MRHVSFIESVANERTDDPLIEPLNTSSHIRRRLLHGQRLQEKQIAAEFGKTPSLLLTCTNLMKEWGFEIVVEDNAFGERYFRCANPDHVPTTRNKRPSNPRPRKMQPADPHIGKSKSDRVRDRLLSGEALSTETVVKENRVSSSFLRKLVSRMEDQGYVIERSGLPGGTYQVVASPDDDHPNRSRNGKAVAKTNGKAMVKPNGTSVPAELIPTPAFLSELRVVALVENDDGELVLGLRSGELRWTAVVSGFQEVSS